MAVEKYEIENRSSEQNAPNYNLSALDWDDTALIKAYNRGMSLRVKDFEKEDNTAKENYKKHSKKKNEWRVGDHCRAIYYADDLWYEAKITSIDGDMCTVDFLGYDEEAEVELNSLDKSLGKKAIKKQKKNARKNFSSDVDESASGEDTRNEVNAVHSPHHHHHSHSRRGHRRNNETYMFDQSNNYTAAESTFHSAYPVARYPEMSTMVPTVVPPCSEVVQNPSLNAMLTAWYMAGYYTGLHQAQKSTSQQHCYCRQTHNCHQ